MEHVAHEGAVTQQARDLRARAWAFVFQCYAKKKAAGATSTNGDEAKGSQHDRPNHSVP